MERKYRPLAQCKEPFGVSGPILWLHSKVIRYSYTQKGKSNSRSLFGVPRGLKEIPQSSTHTATTAGKVFIPLPHFHGETGQLPRQNHGLGGSSLT